MISIRGILGFKNIFEVAESRLYKIWSPEATDEESFALLKEETNKKKLHQN